MRYSVLISNGSKGLDVANFELESMFFDSDSVFNAEERAINRALELSKDSYVKVAKTSDEEFRHYSITLNSESLIENENNIVFDSSLDVSKIRDAILKTPTFEGLFGGVVFQGASQKLKTLIKNNEITSQQIEDFNKMYFKILKFEESGKEYSINQESFVGKSNFKGSDSFIKYYNPDSSYKLNDSNRNAIDYSKEDFYVVYNEKDNDEFYLKLLSKEDVRHFIINNLDQSKNWTYIKADELIKKYNEKEGRLSFSLTSFIENKDLLKSAIELKKYDKDYEQFQNRINLTYKSCINKEVYSLIKDLEKSYPSLVLNPETPSYLFKESDDKYLFYSPKGYKNITFEETILNKEEALGMADRFYLKGAFEREFSSDKKNNSNKNR
jgi:hypothetical protein